MIPQIILALGAALGLIIYVAPNLDTISSALIAEIMAPITQAITSGFTWLAYISPLLIAVVPLYLVLNSRADIKNREQYLVFSVAFGIMLFGLAYATGLDKLLVQALQGSNYVGSSIGVVVSVLGGAAEYLASVLAALALWGAGLLLSILSVVFDSIVGLGHAAEHGSRRIKGGQRGIIEILAGRTGK